MTEDYGPTTAWRPLNRQDLLPYRFVSSASISRPRLAALTALALTVATGVAACGSSSSSSAQAANTTAAVSTSAGAATTAAATTTTAQTTAGQTTAAATTAAAAAGAQSCTKVAAPAPKGPQHLKAPTLKLNPAKKYVVTVATNCGTFAFSLDVKQQPKTSASVYYLVKQGFYNGLTFHRVAANFVIQGGDPLGNGEGGPGYTVTEAPPAGATYPEGTVAMAKTETQPNGASGSQFFVMTGSAGLPAQYAIAGHVTSGFAAVARIGALPTNPPGDGMPTTTVVMSKVTVTTS